MPLISYGDSSDDDEPVNKVSTVSLPKSLNVTPNVNKRSEKQDASSSQYALIHSSNQIVNSSQSHDQSNRPIKRRNILTGHAEEQAFNDATFKIQHRTFQKLGYAYDPSNEGSEIIGDLESAKQHLGQDISQLKVNKKEQKKVRSKRLKGDSTVLDGDNAYKGPWAKFDETSSSSDEYEEGDEEEEENVKSATTTIEEGEIETAKSTSQLPLPLPSDSLPTNSDSESTKFHGSSERDYLGRTYMFVPQDLDINLNKEPGDQEWYLPKKRIHTWSGHAGGVTNVRFFPKSGHLLLSSGNDSKIKLWDVYHERSLLRSYSGHSKAIKDIDFNPAGKSFLSSSYDKTIRLWDTETGKCISRFTEEKAVANSIRFNPKPEHENEFLAAMSNKKILQFDIRTQEIVREYDHHLDAVNTITFVDDNNRFMSTSDDKSIRVWDWGINVPIKLIADPTQHSILSVKLHPSGKYVAGQSMDNKILVFGANNRFKPNRKKEFTGYNNVGYSSEVSFSPDGRYLMSGDSNGFAFFWDWKTSKLYNKLKVHKSLVTCISAHPQETSKLVTAGLDSDIHYWD